jgi:hypothetical protein
MSFSPAFARFAGRGREPEQAHERETPAPWPRELTLQARAVPHRGPGSRAGLQSIEVIEKK